MSERPLIVALIPAYNEEANIAKVIVKAQRHVNKIVVCNDGSKDMTSRIAKALGATVLEHRQNLGYGAAISTLFTESRKLDPDVVVTLDADGQHDPDHIPRLVRPILKKKVDFVIGSRFLSEKGRKKVPGYRKVGIRVITRLASEATYSKITDSQSGFRAYSGKALRAIHPTEEGMGASTEILIKAKQANLTVKEVPITVSYEGKKSKRNPAKHWSDVVLSTIKFLSIRRPLLFYGLPGTIALGIAIVFWIWTLQVFALSRQVVTNITLIAIGMTMVGLMLLTTAIILWVLVSLLRETTASRSY